MYTLHDLDAGYSSDSHTGLYILEYVKHNTSTTASFFVFAIISTWYCLSPYILLAFSLTVFYFAQVSPDLITSWIALSKIAPSHHSLSFALVFLHYTYNNLALFSIFTCVFLFLKSVTTTQI